MRAAYGITSKSQDPLAVQGASPFVTETVIHARKDFIVAPLAAVSETVKGLEKFIITAVYAIPKQMDILSLFKPH